MQLNRKVTQLATIGNVGAGIDGTSKRVCLSSHQSTALRRRQVMPIPPSALPGTQGSQTQPGSPRSSQLSQGDKYYTVRALMESCPGCSERPAGPWRKGCLSWVLKVCDPSREGAACVTAQERAGVCSEKRVWGSMRGRQGWVSWR